MLISNTYLKAVILLLAVLSGLSACSSSDGSSANAQLNVERAERQGL